MSLEILRDKLKTRVSDLEEEMRRLRDELEETVSKKDTSNADDEVMTVTSNHHSQHPLLSRFFIPVCITCLFHKAFSLLTVFSPELRSHAVIGPELSSAVIKFSLFSLFLC